MDLRPFDPWFVLLHILGVFGFLIAHGASVAVAFRLRSERDPARIKALLELSNAYLNAMYGGLTVLLVFGILAGISGAWWTSGKLWIWAAVVLLVLIAVGMYVVALPFFNNVRHAVGLATYDDVRKGLQPPEPASASQLEALLASSAPMTTAVIGLGGLAIIAWLMVLKPF
jgi:hypothetical protein